MKTRLSVFCSKIIEAGWLAAVVAVPLFFNIYSARTFEPDKITLLRSIAMVMILAWIVMVVEQGFGGASENGEGIGKSFGERVRRWIREPLFLPTLLMVFIYVVSTILSISPGVSFWGSYQRLQGSYSMLSYIVIFAMMASTMRTFDQVDRLVTLVIIASVPVSLYGIVQRYGLDPLPWAGDVTQRVASNMGNAIFVASYLIMIIPVTISRLIQAMAAIIRDENASWGHTVLAAVYIFVLAVQVMTVIFSQSRGPMIGILMASAVMGLTYLLILRKNHSDSSSLSFKEIAAGFGFIIPLGLGTAIVAGAGYFIGIGIQNVLGSAEAPLDYVSLIGALIGATIGFIGAFTAMAAANRGWRWMWVSWVGLGMVGVVAVIVLNSSDTPFDPYVEQIRKVPYLNRIADISADSSTGKVRVFIWDAAVQLVTPHGPLGVAGDELAPEDRFNVLRPLVGYGPESMFNAFAYVYPPGLAHVERRGSSADRSHNETMDSLVITGVIGFIAFYYIVTTMFYYAARWLGWAPTQGARRRLIVFLLLSGALGALVPYLLQGRLTFVPVGLPAGIVAGLALHLIVQGIMAIKEDPDVSPQWASNKYANNYGLLMIGVLGAIVGHFIEVHFVFSIAATYTYFWVYAGLLVALVKLKYTGGEVVEEATEVVETPEAEAKPKAESAAARRVKRGRSRRSTRRQSAEPVIVSTTIGTTGHRESWETWLGSQGLSMAIILIILAFNFITPQFEFNLGNKNSASLFWMLTITWLVGAGIALANLAVRSDDWRSPVSWPRASLLFAMTSLSYFLFYTIAHRAQFGQRITVTSIEDVIRAADVLANGLVMFYVFLFLLMAIIAITLMWRGTRGLPFWRSENWWLYPPLAIAIVAVIWFKNIDVVRADIYLKEGERYRNANQWNEAIALHERGRSIDSDEDFYYLMLALDYQLMAQDGNLDANLRQNAWQQGERIALQAREINPYNPDNTGNMGRYYFTLGQVFDQGKFNDALDYFEKATILAPSNVIYHNLWAQTLYIMQDYDAAIDRLQKSVSIDARYAPTWILLGDTYAAQGNAEKALEAHTQGIKVGGWSNFSDQFFDQRLNFFISSGRGDDIIATMQQYALDRPDDTKLQWAIGHAYTLQGQPDKAIAYFEQARALGDKSARTLRELGNIYLVSEDYDNAQPVYQQLIENNPDDVESHSALAYIFARQGRVDDAITHNRAVLERSPNDYDSLKNLAILYQQSQRLPEALEAANNALTAAPEGEQASWSQFIANLEAQMVAEQQN
jgi:tetratricopeptide (TPR) repeat protein